MLKSVFTRHAGAHGESLSDNGSYPALCRRASTDPGVFSNFRRDPDYTGILDHVTERQGKAYLDLISQHSGILHAMDMFKMNDRYGNPKLCEYDTIGMISPSTLRYVKVLADLQSEFHTLDDLRLCEIGVGYGGQCRILNAYYRPSHYCLVDIEPALALARRYLENFVIDAKLTYKTMAELEDASYDLVLSNYAFTELARPLQNVYLSKVILRSRMGYITYNEITPAEFNSFKADELLEMIPGARRIDEQPLTHPANCIILWGGNLDG
jgi:hypothetical protein